MIESQFHSWGFQLRFLTAFFVLTLLLVSCQQANTFLPSAESAPAKQIIKRDLQQIKEEGVLRLITRNNSSSYFVFKGGQFGFEYKLAKMYADSIGVKLEVITPANLDEMIPFLKEGKGDIIGANFKITHDRLKNVEFAEPWYKDDLVLVNHKNSEKILDPMQLAGHTIFVHKGSPAMDALDHWKKMLEDNFRIEYVAENMEEEDILRKVGNGRFECTVASRRIVELEITDTKKLQVGAVIAMHVPVAWAMRQNAPELLKSINSFVKKHQRSKEGNILRKKYFGDKKRLYRQRKHQSFTLESGKLSIYDKTIKKISKKYEFDWRLIAAVIYHESRFDPESLSWAGAKGLMQLMPNTAKTLRMKCFQNNYANIHCGVRLLSKLRGIFENVNEEDRIKFVLASYNAGLGHVRDAQHLAIDTGHNPVVWAGQVEKMVRRLSIRRYYKQTKHGYAKGPGILAYVNGILDSYKTYCQILPPNEVEAVEPKTVIAEVEAQ